MKHEFYDVKAKAKVSTEVTAVAKYGEGARERYAVKGKTKDGRSLTAFVNKAKFDEAAAALGGCCKKGCKKK